MVNSMQYVPVSETFFYYSACVYVADRHSRYFLFHRYLYLDSEVWSGLRNFLWRESSFDSPFFPLMFDAELSL
jgi:hypothetical protein